MKNPKYRLIAEHIKQKITNGEWAVGTKIPSQRQLSEEFRVNRSTVITALEELTAEGLIEGKTGVGTIVTNSSWTLLGQGSLKNWNENLQLGPLKSSLQTVQTINDEESNPDLIQLSKGELSSSFFPKREMQTVMTKMATDFKTFGYEEPKGNERLREEISLHLSKNGLNVSSSSILIVSGALQGLHLIALGLLRRHSTLYLELPSYLYSLTLFQSLGIELKGFNMDQYGVTTKGFADFHKKKALYTIPNFHNPTGAVMPLRKRKELIRFCEEDQLPIIEDDIYQELWIDVPPPPSLKSMDQHGNVLYLGSLSKSLSPGLRIGWVVGPEPVINRLADLKMQSDYGSSSLSQYVAAEWLGSGYHESHVANVRAALKTRRDAVLTYLDEHLSDYADWTVPTGGFFIWLTIKKPFTSKNLFRRALKRGVLINPGSIYSENEAGQHIRISFAYEDLDRIKKGITQLEKIFINKGVDERSVPRAAKRRPVEIWG